MHVAVLVSDLGNSFYREIAELIGCGLAELGIEVQLHCERDGFQDAASCAFQLVIAPHEFFYLGEGQALREQPWPSNVVLFNAEQSETIWYRLASNCFAKASRIWDLDVDGLRRAELYGIPCDHVPLGFSELWRLGKPIRQLPRNFGTCHLDSSERGPTATARLEDRPLDVLFLGTLTPRRERFFAAAAARFARFRCHLHLYHGERPIRSGVSGAYDSATSHGLAERSKIVLNVHHQDKPFFEWHRNVLLGIWRGAAVVTESSPAAPPYTKGRDYFEAELQDIPALIERLMSSAEGQAEAQAVAAQGQNTLRGEGRMAALLLPAIEKLELGEFDHVQDLVPSQDSQVQPKRTSELAA